MHSSRVSSIRTHRPSLFHSFIFLCSGQKSWFKLNFHTIFPHLNVLLWMLIAKTNTHITKNLFNKFVIYKPSSTRWEKIYLKTSTRSIQWNETRTEFRFFFAAFAAVDVFFFLFFSPGQFSVHQVTHNCYYMYNIHPQARAIRVT